MEALDAAFFSSTKTYSGSATFTRNNCPANHTAGSVTYTATASGSATSTISQADADSRALAAAQAKYNADGQNYANVNASCTPQYTCEETITERGEKLPVSPPSSGISANLNLPILKDCDLSERQVSKQIKMSNSDISGIVVTEGEKQFCEVILQFQQDGIKNGYWYKIITTNTTVCTKN